MIADPPPCSSQPTCRSRRADAALAARALILTHDFLPEGSQQIKTTRSTRGHELTTPPPEPEIATGNAADAEVPGTPADVFDRLETFRLRQSFDRVTVRRPLTTVGIRKPKSHEWFQVHPTYRYEGTLFKAKEEGLSEEWFFPTDEAVLAILEELSPTGLREVCIFWWVNRKKNSFVWPVELADSDGRQNDWHASMYEMLNLHGNGHWCRIEAGDGGYSPTIADETDPAATLRLVKPEWPPVDHFGAVLRLAFKGGRAIDTPDHPLIKRLRG